MCNLRTGASSPLCFSSQGGEPEDCRHLPVQKSRVLGFYHLYRPLRPEHEPAGGQLSNFTCLCSHCSPVWGQTYSASLTLNTKSVMQHTMQSIKINNTFKIEITHTLHGKAKWWWISLNNTRPRSYLCVYSTILLIFPILVYEQNNKT